MKYDCSKKLFYLPAYMVYLPPAPLSSKGLHWVKMSPGPQPHMFVVFSGIAHLTETIIVKSSYSKAKN